MDRVQLFEQIKKKQSYLCVGLDSDIDKIPKHLLDKEDPVFEFNKAIIDSTKEFAVAYKPNIAFYECRGSEGWDSLKRTIEYIKKTAPEVFTIADAKRGDIGNTSKMYAKSFFENMNFDSITVAPYMGSDSIGPFLEYPGKWAIILALTSNQGASDFQTNKTAFGESMVRLGIRIGINTPLYETVLSKAQEWGTTDNIMFVVGATQASFISNVRSVAPDHFLLVPGVGAQGGSLEDISIAGLNSHCGLLINSSRGIIFASQNEDFADIAAQKAKELQLQMAQLLKDKELI